MRDGRVPRTLCPKILLLLLIELVLLGLDVEKAYADVHAQSGNVWRIVRLLPQCTPVVYICAWRGRSAPVGVVFERR